MTHAVPRSEAGPTLPEAGPTLPEAPPTLVAVNGKWLGQTRTGTQRYAEELTRRLVGDPRLDVLLCLPRGVPVPTWVPAAVDVRRSRLTGIAFEQLALPVLARGRLVLSLAGPAPLLLRRQVATFHDATPFRFPHTYTRAFGRWHRTIYRVVARRARAVVTVSDFSAGELADVLGLPATRFVVIPDGADHMDDLVGVAPSCAGSPGGFALCVGTLAAHKNLAGVLRELAAAAIPTIVVGARGPGRVFAGGTPTPVSHDGVTYAADLTDAELAWLYRHAIALVFPSRYEGFGLPVIEAQTLDCPVIVARAASLPEVAGPGAISVDPDRPEDVPAILDRLRNDTDFRAEVVAAGRVNAARFSWTESAHRLITVLQTAAGTAGTAGTVGTVGSSHPNGSGESAD